MSANMEFSTLLKRLVRGETLDAETAGNAFAAIMAGEVSEPQIASFLTVLALRDATVAEISGAANAMRAAMHAVAAPDGAIDLCGTGGDGHSTLNISTAASFVVAACGVAVAKHGNRNISSRSGAADVLEALGINIELAPSEAEERLRSTGLCFLFAPAYHTAMKHVAKVRKELGFRTVFNLLGPIANPARVRRQLIGVFSRAWLEPLARVLMQLGTEKAWIVHGRDGLDELTTTDITDVAVLDAGIVTHIEIDPAQLGLQRVELAALRGGTPEHNAQAIRDLFAGAGGPFRDIVLLNAAAALVVAGKAGDIAAGLALGADAIDSGRAGDVLTRLRANASRAAA